MQDSVELIQDVKFRAQVLGFVPQEYVEPIATFIETTAVENPDRLAATINEIVSIFRGDQSAEHLLRRLMVNDSNRTNGVHMELFQSPAVYKWTKTNEAFLIRKHLSQ